MIDSWRVGGLYIDVEFVMESKCDFDIFFASDIKSTPVERGLEIQ